MIKKKNLTTFFSFLLSVLLILGSTSVSFADEKNSSLVKEYEFKTDYVDDLSYDAKEKIKQDGKTYKLVSIDYEVVKDNTIKVKKKISTTDKSKYEKSVEYQLPSGKMIKLHIRDKIKWKKHVSAVTKTQEYRSLNVVPEEINTTKETPDGSVIDIVLSLSDTENFTRVEKFSSPANFYAYMENAVMYMFNGEKVRIAGNTPVWSGYQDDVKRYLGLNGSAYEITGGVWSTSFVPYGEDQYIRTATFTGTKSTPLVRATFVETDETANMFVADVTYVGFDPDNRSVACAFASYERCIGTKEAVAIGVGVLILILGTVTALYIVAKRKRNEQE